jgi:hypothetical protein
MAKNEKNPELESLKVISESLKDSIEKRRADLGNRTQSEKTAYSSTIALEQSRLDEVNARISELTGSSKG